VRQCAPSTTSCSTAAENDRKGLAVGCDRPTVGGVSAGRERPTILQWLRYAYGGWLPRELSGWVLRDTTGRWWWCRHLARSVLQLLPVVVLCLVVPPAPLGYHA